MAMERTLAESRILVEVAADPPEGRDESIDAGVESPAEDSPSLLRLDRRDAPVDALLDLDPRGLPARRGGCTGVSCRLGLSVLFGSCILILCERKMIQMEDLMEDWDGWLECSDVM